MRPRPRPRPPVLLVAVILMGCDHTEPFLPPPYGSPPPPAAAQVRLTYNLGQDQSPAWLPSGGGFFYGRQRLDRADHDWCLALMPADGGAIRREICDVLPGAADSTDAWQSPGPGPGGRLAYVRSTAYAPLGSIAPYRTELVVGTLSDPARGGVLKVLPGQAPSGRSYDMASQIRWLGPSSIVYLAERVAYGAACGSCPVDTLRWGQEIVKADWGGPVPVFAMLPGSDQASSVAVAGSDTVYYTTNGDSRVYRLVLSTEAITVVHDFGLAGIARDVQVAGGRLVAVVGGSVSFDNDPLIGRVQRDGGGTLYLVSLATGARQALTSGMELFRHPALSPAGDHLVAEMITGGSSEIWAVRLP